MSLIQTLVTFDRLKATAEMLGSQDIDLCPPIIDHDCWLKRNLDSYFTTEPSAEYECAECWLRFFINGD